MAPTVPDLAFITDKPCVAAIKAVSSLTDRAEPPHPLREAPTPCRLPSSDKLTGSCQRNSEINEVGLVFIMSLRSLTRPKKIWTATDFSPNIETTS